MRREGRVTVQGPVKEQQPDGMSEWKTERGGTECIVAVHPPIHTPLHMYALVRAQSVLNGPQWVGMHIHCYQNGDPNVPLAVINNPPKIEIFQPTHAGLKMVKSAPARPHRGAHLGHLETVPENPRYWSGGPGGRKMFN